MRLSKHHYATALAKAGNQVFFLEPANPLAAFITQREEMPGLSVINYPLVARGWGKLPGWLYRRMVAREMKKLEEVIGQPDVVWCFDLHKIVHTSYFNCLKIFHLVDHFSQYYFNRYKVQPDLCFSTMPAMVDRFIQNGFHAEFIQHGLGESFLHYAEKRLASCSSGTWKNEATVGVLHVGFAGNLLGQALDRDTMAAVINENPDCHFHFWGKYEKDDKYIELAHFNPEFVDFLKSRNNVTLYGTVSTQDLAREMQKMNMFWVVWNTTADEMWSSDTNPHKIIEYLSTGVPVISHFIKLYEGAELLTMMNKDGGSEEFRRIFAEKKSGILKGEIDHKSADRISFAMQNSYAHQVEKIENVINQKAGVSL